MSSIRNIVGKVLISLAVLVAVSTFVGSANAADCATAEACKEAAVGDSNMGLAIGAGLAVGLAGLGTGLAQKDIGAAAVGAVAEDPAFLGRAILFIAIPETIVIFGVLIAFQLVGKIG